MEALDEEMGIGFDRSTHPAADESPLLAGLDLGGVAGELRVHRARRDAARPGDARPRTRRRQPRTRRRHRGPPCHGDAVAAARRAGRLRQRARRRHRDPKRRTARRVRSCSGGSVTAIRRLHDAVRVPPACRGGPRARRRVRRARPPARKDASATSWPGRCCATTSWSCWDVRGHRRSANSASTS